MALKQPRVPEYREQDGTGRNLRSLILFLKDFCMGVWTAMCRQEKRMDELEQRMKALEDGQG